MHPINCFLKFCILLVKVQVFIFQFFVPGLQLCYGRAAVGCFALFGKPLYNRSLWGYVACYLIRNELVAHIIIHIHKVLVGHRKDSHRCLTYGANGILRNLIEAITAAFGTIVNSQFTHNFISRHL